MWSPLKCWSAISTSSSRMSSGTGTFLHFLKSSTSFLVLLISTFKQLLLHLSAKLRSGVCALHCYHFRVVIVESRDWKKYQLWWGCVQQTEQPLDGSSSISTATVSSDLRYSPTDRVVFIFITSFTFWCWSFYSLYTILSKCALNQI